MNSKKYMVVITVFVFAIILIAFFVLRNHNITRAHELYKQGLEFETENDFQNAYYNFSKISRFSDLGEISILKQAMCALEAHDEKIAYDKFNYLANFSHDKHIAPVALYNCALIEINREKYLSAQRKLKKLYKKYPQSDYKKAACAQLGILLSKKDKKSSLKYFIEYLEYAPDGRYAKSLLEKVQKLNLTFSDKEKYIIANALFQNGYAQKALSFLDNHDDPRVELLTGKIYEFNGNNEAAFAAYSNTLRIADDTLEPVDIAFAAEKYFMLSKAQSDATMRLYLQKSKNRVSLPAMIYVFASKLPSYRKVGRYEIILKEFPDSYWSAESLWNVFWYNYKKGNYETAKKLAHRHGEKYSDSNSAAKIKFWYAKILLKENKTAAANDILQGIVRAYPSSYYSYVSQNLLYNIKTPLNTKKRGDIKTSKFSDKDLENIFNGDKTLVALAKLNDIETIKKLRIDDIFVKSYISHCENNVPYSVFLARKGIDELTAPLNFKDARYKLAYPIAYEDEINKYAKEYKQNPYLILALIREESTFNSTVKSEAGAVGLMQIMPQTASFIGLSDLSQLLVPNVNIKLGTKYFSNLVKMFDNNEMLAVLSYNGGPGNVSFWSDNLQGADFDEFLEDIPYSETQNYIKKVFASYWNYIRIYGLKN